MMSAIENISFKPGLPLEIEVLQVAPLVNRHRSSITQPHRAAFYHIIWIQKGTATHLIDFKPVKVKAGTFLFVNKDHVQLFDPKRGYDGQLLLFTEAFFGKHPSDLQFLRNSILFNDLLEDPLLRVAAGSTMALLFNEIVKELSHPGDPYHADLLRNALQNLLLLADRERRKTGFKPISPGPDLEYTMQFRNLLDKQFKEVKTVAGYAKQIAVSDKRLTRATHLVLGKTPKQLIDERILLEIKRLLVHTHLSIKEIAFDLGFDEPTNFIKYFRHHEKITPIAFREKYVG